MSQAVIDFTERLKTTLLTLEERLGKAKEAIDANASKASEQARKHIEEAVEQIETFRAHASVMAQAIRADLPQQTAAAKEILQEFSQEAQVAMRHAVVFLAEATSKGAASAAGALNAGAKSAHLLAEDLKHETAITVIEPKPDAQN